LRLGIVGAAELGYEREGTEKEVDVGRGDGGGQQGRVVGPEEEGEVDGNLAGWIGDCDDERGTTWAQDCGFGVWWGYRGV
jgi:hypothetical protein